MNNFKALCLLFKSMFTCVHFVEDCTADERVKKLSDDGEIEEWGCYCTCKCGKTNIKKVISFKKSYLDALRSAGVE